MNIDQYTISYIMGYFSRLFTDHENAALRYLSFSDSQKKMLERVDDKHPLKKSIYLTAEAQELANLGLEKLERQIVRRVLTECPVKIFFNNCPVCGKLARTPYAQQCRHCGHDWHDKSKGLFKIKTAFTITGQSYFVIAGEVIRGNLQKNDRIDLSAYKVHRKVKVTDIGGIRMRPDGTSWVKPSFNDVALRIDELNEEEKILLKEIQSWARPVEIHDI